MAYAEKTQYVEQSTTILYAHVPVVMMVIRFLGVQ